MKKLLLSTIALALVSCAKENTTLSAQHDLSLSSKIELSNSAIVAVDPARNPNNPFDEVGKVHDQLFEAYFAMTTHDKSIAGIAAEVESLAAASHAFSGIRGASTSRNTAAKLQSLVGTETTAVSDAINKSSLSQYAKSSLQNFCDKIVVLYPSVDEFDPLFTFIANYESQLAGDSKLTPVEREKILTVTSITRYSTYKGKKKPKKNNDSDWDMMGFGLAGSIDGIEKNPAESIITAFSAKVLQNK
ncbi:hypothetical protein [Pedobacter sp. ASV28]|uniref:hypothetical protein n=1 Tax=Pedobacter sp. ASV28 TaxID=2795123 RepID=UPI0018EE324A|nr:hypothetical protein [Pedobacter sp. ASV28]